MKDIADPNNYHEMPMSSMYTEDNKVNAVARTVTQICSQASNLEVGPNALNDTFSLVSSISQKTKMVLSAWVKEGGNDCKCVTYANNKITVTYKDDPQTETFRPAGSIINGWQRYESVFTLP
ncbi:MAG: hypothetical protein HY305_02135 [Sphingobacteriales bacterium]|nr:hypothetical protein [Sphingobacteriales bacterium]